MTGLEYILLHVQEPILYVIRKQYRHSPTQATPQADYYIIAGVVYQAPDLASVINSRLLSAVHHLQSSFEEASGFSRYHPSKGYSWDFQKATKPKETEKPREEPSSVFQRQRVDMLLNELVRKFPITVPQQKIATPAPSIKTESETSPALNEKDIKTEIKQEKGMKPPPEKKMKPN